MIDALKLAAQVVAQGEEFVYRFHSIFSLERVEGVEPTVDGLEAGGVELHLVYLRTEFSCQIFELDVTVVDSLAGFFCAGVKGLDVMQSGGKGAQGGEQTGVFAVQLIDGQIESGFNFLGVRYGLGLLFEFFLLAGLQLRFLEFATLKPEIFFAFATVGELGFEFPQMGLCSLILAEDLAIVGKLRGVLGDEVYRAELKVFLAQEQVLVLTVDVDEPLAQLFEHAQSYGHVVDEGAALARGVDFAAEDAVGGVVVDVVTLEEVGQVVSLDIEVGLDGAFLRAVLDGFHVGALPHHQAQSSKDDALSGSGLAGDDGESGLEGNIEFVDERKILNI